MKVEIKRTPVGVINPDFVNNMIRKYREVFGSLRIIEKHLEPVLKTFNLEFLYREDAFEPVFNAREDELLRYSVISKDEEDDDCMLYLVVKKNGVIVIEREIRGGESS